MIVGICGQAQNGKTTLANHLVKKYGFVEVAFATPLKLACMHAFGFTHDQVFGKGKDITDDYWNITPRRALQFIGTNCFRRHLGKDFWITRAEIDIIKLREKGKSIVISDVRFPNELDLVKGYKGTTVRVIRPGHEITESNHPSENSLEGIPTDFTIINDGTIKDLERRFDAIF